MYTQHSLGSSFVTFLFMFVMCLIKKHNYAKQKVYANDHCIIFIENYSIMTIHFTMVSIFHNVSFVPLFRCSKLNDWGYDH